MDLIILVFVNNQLERLWLHRMDICWNSLPSLTTKAIITHLYLELINFINFFMKLSIPNTLLSKLVDELCVIEGMHQGQSIPPVVQEHITDILTDISDIVEGMDCSQGL